MHFKPAFMSLFLLSLAAASCNNNDSGDNKKAEPTLTTPDISEEKTSYDLNGKTYEAYFAYDKNAEGTRPGTPGRCAVSGGLVSPQTEDCRLCDLTYVPVISLI